MTLAQAERPILFAVHHRGVVNQGHVHQNFVLQEHLGESLMERVVDGGFQVAKHADDPVFLLQDLFGRNLAVFYVFLPAFMIVEEVLP